MPRRYLPTTEPATRLLDLDVHQTQGFMPLRDRRSLRRGYLRGPSVYELDDDITVELRNKKGTTLNTQKAVVETIEEQGTTQDLSKASFQRRERRFSFDGKQNGNYVLAFILHKNGIPQPALIFPIKYSHESHPADRVYMLEPICPK